MFQYREGTIVFPFDAEGLDVLLEWVSVGLSEKPDGWSDEAWARLRSVVAELEWALEGK